MPVAASRVDVSFLALSSTRTRLCPNRESPKNDGSVFRTATPEFCPNLPLKVCPVDLLIDGAPLFLAEFLVLNCLLHVRRADEIRSEEFVSLGNRLTTHPGEQLFVLIYNMIPIVIAFDSHLCSIAVSVN